MMYLAYLFLLFPTSLLAQSVSVNQNNGKVDLEIQAMPLPKQYLDKSLQSGLSTNIFMRATILDGNEKILIMDRAYKAYFDLWDEVYHLNLRSEGASKKERFNSKKELLEKIGNVQFSGKPSSQTVIPENVKIRLKIVIDPVSKEKVKKIRKWLAQNMVNSPSLSSRSSGSTGSQQPSSAQITSPPGGGISNGSVFRGVMASIFESELKNDSSAGGWVHQFEKSVIVGRKK